MNGTHDAGDVSSEEFNLSDNEADDAPDTGLGDYSAVFEEVMSDGEDEGGHANGDDEEEEGFVYSGVDADPSGGYREQLREVLGQDHEEDELEDEQEVERSLVHEVAENEKFAATIEDEAGVSGPTYTRYSPGELMSIIERTSMSRYYPLAPLLQCPPRLLLHSTRHRECPVILRTVRRHARHWRVRICTRPSLVFAQSHPSPPARRPQQAAQRYILICTSLHLPLHPTSPPCPDRPPSPTYLLISHNTRALPCNPFPVRSYVGRNSAL